MKITTLKRFVVTRHELPFRVLHWSIFAEGVLLTLTGLQLGGFAGIVVVTASTTGLHTLTGLAFIATAVVFLVDMLRTGDYRWVGLRRIPHSLRFILAETRAWFGIGPRTEDPMVFDSDWGDYREKLVPSVIVVFWVFVVLGVALGLTGLALAYPAPFGFVFAVTDPIGRAFTGVTGMAFMLVIHRLLTFFLVALVAAHVYASFVFKLVRSMVTGKREEAVTGHVDLALAKKPSSPEK